MKVEKQKNFLIRFAYLALVLGLAYVGIEHVLPAILPLVLALAMAVIFKGPIDKLSKSRKIKKPLAAIIILLIFYGIFSVIIVLIFSQLLSLIQNGIAHLPGFYKHTVEPFLNNSSERILVMFPQIEDNIEWITQYITSTLSSFITSGSELIISGIGGIFGRIPSIFVNGLFTIIASFFFTVYYHDITAFVFRQLSEEKAIKSRHFKENVIETILSYLRSYAQIISITFVELTIGMTILGIAYPLGVAALVSLIDILPVLGVGTILIPWALIGFVMGNYKIGIGMLVLYLVITIIRQTIEPKIVGKQIGIHPVAALSLVYVGGRLFGLIGIFILPVTAVMIKRLHEDGTLNWLK